MFAAYVLIPWVGVTAVGFGLGQVFSWEPERRRNFLLRAGLALLFLRAVDGHTPKVMRPALTYGRVPLFYYVLHLSLIHLIAVGICYVRYGVVHWMFESPDLANTPFTRPPGWGMGLLGVYLWW